MVLPFWYRFTWVVPEKRVIKRVCVCCCCHCGTVSPNQQYQSTGKGKGEIMGREAKGRAMNSQNDGM